MRSIGIPVANRPECVNALDQAFRLAQLLGSDVLGYHMRPNRKASTNISLGQLLVGDDSDKLWLSTSPDEEKHAAISARELFVRMTETHDYELKKKRGKPERPAASYLEKVGSPQMLMPIIGPVNDLLIVSRPATSKSAKAISIMRTALLTSRVPVLVLPKKAKKLSHGKLILAWNRGRSESILMHNTLDLMRKADEVIVLSVGRDHHHGPTAKDAADYLASQGIRARNRQVQAKHDGDGLVKTFREENADMLLCGAYTRGQLRETVFGGMTRYLLEKTELPVIFQHV